MRLLTSTVLVLVVAGLTSGQVPPAFKPAPKYRVSFSGAVPAALNGTQVLFQTKANEWLTAGAFQAGGHTGPLLLKWDTQFMPYRWHLYLSDGHGGHCHQLNYTSYDSTWDGQTPLTLNRASNDQIATGPKTVLLEVAP